MSDMRGYEIKFNIYAEDEAEVEQAKDAIVAFISEHARQGRAVTGKKIAKAVSDWKSNPLVRNRIISYFK